MLQGRHVLLVISGSVSAFKALELMRLLRKAGARVTPVLTAGGARFVTPHAVQAIAGEPVHQDLWSLAGEAEIGHIRLARMAELVAVVPASADFLAKMAHGLADDLASTVMLATDKPILVAPAMNWAMWGHSATQANMALLDSRGLRRIGPGTGAMAESESGPGRLAEPAEIFDAIAAMLTAPADTPLAGRHALVTSGPTQEPIDPVRYISNRSSGQQGHAIALALAGLGARVTLVSGPVSLPDPAGVNLVRVETAEQMLAACEAALPADIAVCAAAVADWRVAHAATQKMKKKPGEAPPPLELALNPDILATLSRHARRPRLVVGFAAETEHVIDHARQKLARKGCDWILANDVSADVFGAAENTVHLVGRDGVEDWPKLPKTEVGRRLAARIADEFQTATDPA
ncbi:bifunctional phosphopantothenoylcysteine decarboxylase/phosphopantothenate synthase [Pseudoroseomonas deserti]|uniref:Coenzyme A biosynthesis bifunctional protein CoaBC n=1 Tax=Teichococcus deserti TaxID=1817963 RepID=A0A1V2H194_9PROT|nr:bifunctional phosphopantothenoylcysteine decarboxylase/phosphopantothenate--cysteine ligase CoaBC [Pseudoroseomonas deserti]ONG52963.1 bifunctional phosphopantothenoylcysteine decarboxylase/phosphopantothenate synthase [Pseudoroseomonas deserti]